MGAAFGFAEDVNIQAGFQSVRSWRNQQISNAISAIKSARTCTGWAILLLVVARGVTIKEVPTKELFGLSIVKACP
jgi:hypothetical protein